MATPMIEQFPKGKLNKCWHYIDLCKYVHPELTGTIDRMRGLGYGLEAQMQEAELPKEHFDLEKAIVDCRLDYVRQGKVYQNGAW